MRNYFLQGWDAVSGPFGMGGLILGFEGWGHPILGPSSLENNIFEDEGRIGIPILVGEQSLKLGACVDVLGGLLHNVIGTSASDACCPVVAGVAGLDAALCLCTMIKAKLLNINLFLPIALQLLVGCGKNVPAGFQCPV